MKSIYNNVVEILTDISIIEENPNFEDVEKIIKNLYEFFVEKEEEKVYNSLLEIINLKDKELPVVKNMIKNILIKSVMLNIYKMLDKFDKNFKKDFDSNNFTNLKFLADDIYKIYLILILVKYLIFFYGTPNLRVV